jgi:hypothetical protein
MPSFRRNVPSQSCGLKQNWLAMQGHEVKKGTRSYNPNFLLKITYGTWNGRFSLTIPFPASGNKPCAFHKSRFLSYFPCFEKWMEACEITLLSVYPCILYFWSSMRSVSMLSGCHHGMARPQVADGGDALQIWRVAENILNKQSWTTDKRRTSSFTP